MFGNYEMANLFRQVKLLEQKLFLCLCGLFGNQPKKPGFLGPFEVLTHRLYKAGAPGCIAKPVLESLVLLLVEISLGKNKLSAFKE